MVQGFAWKVGSGNALFLGAGLSGRSIAPTGLPSYSAPPVGNGATVSITKTEAPLGSTPHVVKFSAGSHSGFDSDVEGRTHVWVIEDSPLTYGGVGNIPDVWKDPNIALGDEVVFVFPEATTYTIWLYVIDQSGNRARASTTVTPTSQDDEFPTTQTICLDPSANYTGAPSGAQQVSTVSAMQTAVNNATSQCRVLVARGSDITDFALSNTDGDLKHVGAFGSGNRPILRPSYSTGHVISVAGTSSTQFTTQDLDCRGLWDAATETGLPTNSVRSFGGSLEYLLHDNCRFDGFDFGVTPEGRSSGTVLATLHNTEVTNWRDYGVYQQTNTSFELAEIGCDISQHADGRNGSHQIVGRNGLINMQGASRIASAAFFYTDMTSYFTRGGWSGGTDQPCLRLNAEGGAGGKARIIRTTMEGGLQPFVTSNGSAPNELDLWMSAVLLVGAGKTSELALLYAGGGTYQNMIAAYTNAEGVTGVAQSVHLSMSGIPADTSNEAARVVVTHCTALNLRNTTNDVLGDVPNITNHGSYFSDYTEENCVEHAPNIDTPVDGNLDSSGASGTGRDISGFSARYKGILPNYDFITTGTGAGTSRLTLSYPSGTSQSYFQTREAAGDTKHAVWFDTGSQNFWAEAGDFSVTFNAGDIYLDKTSGNWPSGSFDVRLDRSGDLPADDLDSGYTGAIPLPVPDGLADDDTADIIPFLDVEMKVRPGAGSLDHQGNSRPSSGNKPGAVQNT